MHSTKSWKTPGFTGVKIMAEMLKSCSFHSSYSYACFCDWLESNNRLGCILFLWRIFDYCILKQGFYCWLVTEFSLPLCFADCCPSPACDAPPPPPPPPLPPPPLLFLLLLFLLSTCYSFRDLPSPTGTSSSSCRNPFPLFLLLLLLLLLLLPANSVLSRRFADYKRISSISSLTRTPLIKI